MVVASVIENLKNSGNNLNHFDEILQRCNPNITINDQTLWQTFKSNLNSVTTELLNDPISNAELIKSLKRQLTFYVEEYKSMKNIYTTDYIEKTEYDKVKKQLNKTNEKLKQLNIKIRDITPNTQIIENFEKIQTENKALQEQIVNLVAEKAKISAEINRLTQLVESERVTEESNKKQLNDQNINLQNQIASLQSQNTDLGNQIRILQSENQKTHTQNNLPADSHLNSECSAKLNELNDKYEKLIYRFNEGNLQFEQIQTENNALKQKIAILETTIDKKNQENNELSNVNIQYNQAIKTLLDKIDIPTNTINDLEQLTKAFDEIYHLLDTLETAKKDSEKRVTDLYANVIQTLGDNYTNHLKDVMNSNIKEINDKFNEIKTINNPQLVNTGINKKEVNEMENFYNNKITKFNELNQIETKTYNIIKEELNKIKSTNYNDSFISNKTEELLNITHFLNFILKLTATILDTLQFYKQENLYLSQQTISAFKLLVPPDTPGYSSSQPATSEIFSQSSSFQIPEYINSDLKILPPSNSAEGIINNDVDIIDVSNDVPPVINPKNNEQTGRMEIDKTFNEPSPEKQRLNDFKNNNKTPETQTKKQNRSRKYREKKRIEKADKSRNLPDAETLSSDDSSRSNNTDDPPDFSETENENTSSTLRNTNDEIENEISNNNSNMLTVTETSNTINSEESNLTTSDLTAHSSAAEF